jgi:dCMP deaminase
MQILRREDRKTEAALDDALKEIERLKAGCAPVCARQEGDGVMAEELAAKEQRWHLHFLAIAQECARMSKDASTKVGSVIVGPDREIRSTGFNGLPRGIADTEARLSTREVKLQLVVHAEMNAVLNAARFGAPLRGCTLYIAAMNSDGDIWGGPPCTRCAVEIIQAGIAKVVSYPQKAVPSRWHEDLLIAHGVLHEAGIGYLEIECDGLLRASVAPDAQPAKAGVQ